MTGSLITGLRDLFAFEFMVNAFAAGTIAAIVAAVVGWLVVLRREAFAAHTLSVVGFPGAAGAALIGAPVAAGYLAFALIAAAAMAPGAMARRGRDVEESATVGTVQAFSLALGFLFITLGHRSASAAQALLFGSFLGISAEQVIALLGGGVLVLTVLAAILRPLLFASIDPEVAEATGVPVRGMAVAFILLVGVTVAEVSQITGSLLVFALIVLPPAAAHALTARPGRSITCAIGIALAATWSGLALSYFASLPIGFTVTSLAFGAYAIAGGWAAVRDAAYTRTAPATAAHA